MTITLIILEFLKEILYSLCNSYLCWMLIWKKNCFRQISIKYWIANSYLIHTLNWYSKHQTFFYFDMPILLCPYLINFVSKFRIHSTCTNFSISYLGTIHISRRLILGLFCTHPPTTQRCVLPISFPVDLLLWQ